MPLPRVRASALPSQPDCPRQAAAKSWTKEIQAQGFNLRSIKQSVGAAMGVVVHTVAAEMLRSGNKKNAESLALFDFDQKISYGVEWDATTPGKAEAQLQIRQMIQAVEPICNQMLPEQIETKLQYTLPETAWVVNEETGELEKRETGNQIAEVSGHLDVRESTGWVWDFKTGARLPQPQAQLGSYALGCVTNGLNVDGLGMFFIQRHKDGRMPDVVRLDFDVAESINYAWSIIEQMAAQWREFELSGSPWAFPANPMSQRCTPKYCNAHSTNFCTVGKPVD